MVRTRMEERMEGRQDRITHATPDEKTVERQKTAKCLPANRLIK